MKPETTSKVAKRDVQDNPSSTNSNAVHVHVHTTLQAETTPLQEAVITPSSSMNSQQDDATINKETVGQDATALRPIPTPRNSNSTGQRRSSRNQQQSIRLSGPWARRFHQLFFDDDHTPRNPKRKRACNTVTLTTLPTVHKRLPVPGRTSLSMARILSSPHIYVIDDFLTQAELAHLDHLKQHGTFQTSFVDALPQGKTITDQQHRTSTFLSLQKRQDSKIAAIEQRATDVFGGFLDQIEPLQLVRYRPGQFFGEHHDLADLLPDDHQNLQLPPKSYHCKRRLATLFCYLNTLQHGAGGATYFPICGLRVAPKRGRAVVFCNIQANGRPDPRTIHAAEPPTHDTKYGLNVWFCEP